MAAARSPSFELFLLFALAKYVMLPTAVGTLSIASISLSLRISSRCFMRICFSAQYATRRFANGLSACISVSGFCTSVFGACVFAQIVTDTMKQETIFIIVIMEIITREKTFGKFLVE